MNPSTFGVSLWGWPGPFPGGDGLYDSLPQAVLARVLGNLPELQQGWLRQTDGRVRFPYVVLTPLWDDPEWNTGGVRYPEWCHLQINLVACGPAAAAESLAYRDRAYRLFTPAKDGQGRVTRPAMLFRDGLDGGCLPGRKFGQVKPVNGPGNQPVWTHGFDLQFYVTRSM